MLASRSTAVSGGAKTVYTVCGSQAEGVAILVGAATNHVGGGVERQEKKSWCGEVKQWQDSSESAR